MFPTTPSDKVDPSDCCGSAEVNWDMRKATLLIVLFALVMSCSPGARADAYDAKPKLIVVLVFDQFRGDYLDRYRAEFKAKNGWNLFLKQGAHFTDCYYDYACSGLIKCIFFSHNLAQ